MWFTGSTVVGIQIVIGIVTAKGFCVGYTISMIISTLGNWKGIIFIATSMLLQNLIYIPSIIALAVSGMKLYKSITKDKRKENIKFELIRHTIFSIIIFIIICIASIIEAYLSTNLLLLIITKLWFVKLKENSLNLFTIMNYFDITYVNRHNMF